MKTVKDGDMADLPERTEQESLVSRDDSIAQPDQGPAASPPALPDSGVRSRRRQPPGQEDSRAPAGGMQQLALPLEPEQPLPPPAGEPETVSTPSAKKNRRRRKPGGFVPVTRDPDVARSYSDSAAMDSAIAEGLAQVLTRLPPEELAALRERVAKARGQRTVNSE